MPVYEYRCTSCGERSEVIQKVNDQPLRICPSCGGELTKMPSVPALQFKGSGFYLTDYGRAGQSGSGEKAAEASKSGDESGKTTDSKPAGDAKGKPETKPAESKPTGE